MKKVLLAVTGCGVAAALALPGSAVGQVPTGDSVVGSGHVNVTDFTVSIQAGRNGENPTGSLALSGFGGALNFTATPTCLNVSGNAAVGGFQIAGSFLGFEGFLASVVDNGPPVNGQPVDTVVYSGLLPTAPTTCPAPGEPPPPELFSTLGGPLTSGDLTVIDAPSLPASTSQCKTGGWRNFGVFKNEGDCVSFVATGGKNPPDGP
jgi:hypothetical protein